MEESEVFMRYRDYNPDQTRMFPPSFGEMIPKGSPVWMMMDIINADLLRGFESRKSDEGNTPYNPLMMTRLLVWAYANRVHSSRVIERRTYTDVELLYMCDTQHPDHNSISRFRKKFAWFLSGLYKKVYRAAFKLQLTKMLVLSVDGSHIKGNVSGKKGCRELKKWEEIEKELDVKIAEYERKSEEVDSSEDKAYGVDKGISLPKEYQDVKKRRARIREVLKELEDEDRETKINLTDPGARFLKKKKKGGYTFGYNIGFTVDENQLIADISITNSSSDQGGLTTGIEGVEKTIGGEIPHGTKILADAGYFSADNIDYLAGKSLDGYIAPSMDFKTDKFEKEWRYRFFRYDSEKDAVICRYGRELARHIPDKPPKKDIEQFKAKEDCTDCPFKNECSPKASRKFISFMRGIDSRTQMTEKMLAEESRKLYVKRKTTVEPTIGDIKYNQGLTQLNVRGFLGNVEACLTGLWHNIKILAKMDGFNAAKWIYA